MNDERLSIPAFKDPTGAKPSSPPMLLVTGMSGAGRTSALKALEDLGFEAIDNVPLALLKSLVQPIQPSFGAPGLTRPLAIGIDIRTRDFGADAFVAELDRLTAEHGIDAKVLFVDCDDDELRRRYDETRHRHPLAADRPVADGIAHERRMVSGLRDRADIAVDTTGLGPGQLKRILKGHFAPEAADRLSVFVTSFAYRRGLPREADLVFDVRFLANPHYDPQLKPLSGQDGAVADFISGDADFETFFNALTGLLAPLVPRYAAEGKSYLTIAFGCTGGRHRSVFVAERLARWLEERGQHVHLLHRDMDRT